MNRIVQSLYFTAALLVFWITPVAAATCPAENFIQSAGEAFMGASREGSPAAFMNASSRYADLHGIALFALGQYRKNLSSDMEGEYFSRARTFMGRFMAQYASHFSGTGVTITSCADSGSGLTVGAKLTGGQSITFRLRKSGSTYRVQDVSVSSIWLAQTMRTKFTGVISSHGGDVGALLAFLGN